MAKLYDTGIRQYFNAERFMRKLNKGKLNEGDFCNNGNISITYKGGQVVIEEHNGKMRPYQA